jgi:hypothetical protein
MTIFNQIGVTQTLYSGSGFEPPRLFALQDNSYLAITYRSDGKLIVEKYNAFAERQTEPSTIWTNPDPLRVSVHDFQVAPDGSLVLQTFKSDPGGALILTYTRFDARGFELGTTSLPMSSTAYAATSDVSGIGFSTRLADQYSDGRAELYLDVVNLNNSSVILQDKMLSNYTNLAPGKIFSIGDGRALITWTDYGSTFGRVVDAAGNLQPFVMGLGRPFGDMKVVDTPDGFKLLFFDGEKTQSPFTIADYDDTGARVGVNTNPGLVGFGFNPQINGSTRSISDADLMPDGTIAVSFREGGLVGKTSIYDGIVRIFDEDAGIVREVIPPVSGRDVASLSTAVLQNGNVAMGLQNQPQFSSPGTQNLVSLFDVVYTEASDARTLNATTSEAVDLGVGTDHVVYAANRAGFQIFQPDSAGNGAEIARLYDHFLGRAPDAGGFDYWLGQLQGGQSLLQVAQRFADSDEFRNNWSGLSDRAFVEEAYLRLFERTGDKGGVDYWTERIASDGRAGVLLELSKAEAADDSLHWRNETVVRAPNGSFDKLTNVERVVFADGIVALDLGRGEHTGEALRMYDTAFDRGADRGGLTYWTRQLDAGLSLKDMAQAFINSAEGTDLRTASNTDFVKALYQRGLEREADSGGLNYWVGRVAADGKAAVLAEISESAEHFQLLQDQITTPVILDRYTIPGV